ncbi:uncharacterized protein UBRO_20790 [Ustilago bromivora]|uniref:Uncharacterized protein n=1 Tax=Ustilago bromivora TaxID=307758 RepID=A0A1K0G7U6_9BASI|nr:uncharacterized protein UBRO_20790 [Ustilago bromivora]
MLSPLLTFVALCSLSPSLCSFNVTTTTDDSLDISAQLFWQSTTPTSSTTQTRNIPVLSRSGSTSTPDIYISCPNRVSGSATGKKNFTWLSADILCLITIIYNSTPVKPNHIKAKLRWVQETYYKEKKKLPLTGAGMLLEDMDASNLSYTSCLALSTNSAEIPMDLSGSELYDHSAHGHGLPPILDLMDSANPPAAIASTSGGSIAGAGDDDIFTTPFPSQAQPSFSAAGGLDVFESSSSSSSAPLSPGTKRK